MVFAMRTPRTIHDSGTQGAEVSNRGDFMGPESKPDASNNRAPAGDLPGPDLPVHNPPSPFQEGYRPTDEQRSDPGQAPTAPRSPMR